MNLENKFFYRLVKVTYTFWLLVCVTVILFALFINIPSKKIDSNLSFIACDNGHNYSLNDAKLFLNTNSAFDDETDHQAKRVCHYGLSITNPDAAKEIAENTKKKHPHDLWDLGIVPIEKTYSLTLKYQNRDWSNFKEILIDCIIGFELIYAFLNILKETFLYLAFGKKFNWNWVLMK